MRTYLACFTFGLLLSTSSFLGCADGQQLDAEPSGGNGDLDPSRFVLVGDASPFADGACSEFFCWEQPQPFGGQVNELIAVGTTVWLAAEGALARRIDGEWSAASTHNLKDVWALSDDEVWAVGAGGAIVHWDGQVLSEVASPTTESLNGIWGAAADDIWAVGDGGVILHYDGSAWTQKGQTYYDMHDVWGSGPNDVYAVGGELNIYTIAHFDGSSLSIGESGLSGAALQTVDGAGPDAVFAAGEYGSVYRLTSNNGVPFASLVGHTDNQSVSDIQVQSETHVWLATDLGLYFYGGTSPALVTAIGSRTILADPVAPQWLLGGSGVKALTAGEPTTEIAPPRFEQLWLGADGNGVAISADGEVLYNAGGDWQPTAQIIDDYAWRFAVGGTNDGTSYAFYDGDEGLSTYAIKGATATAMVAPQWLPSVVVGTSPTDIWTFSFSTYEHFNGASWQAGEMGMVPYGATALAPDEVWAVGEFDAGGGAAAFYDGSSWSVQPVGTTKHVLSSVTAFQGKIYAAGVLRDWDQNQNCGGWNCPLLEPALFELSGGVWRQLSVPGVTSAYEYNQNAIVAANETELFFAVSEPAPGLDNLLVFDGSNWSARPFPAASVSGMFPADDGSLRLGAGNFPYGIMRSR